MGGTPASAGLDPYTYMTAADPCDMGDLVSDSGRGRSIWNELDQRRGLGASPTAWRVVGWLQASGNDTARSSSGSPARRLLVPSCHNIVGMPISDVAQLGSLWLSIKWTGLCPSATQFLLALISSS